MLNCTNIPCTHGSPSEMLRASLVKADGCLAVKTKTEIVTDSCSKGLSCEDAIYPDEMLEAAIFQLQDECLLISIVSA